MLLALLFGIFVVLIIFRVPVATSLALSALSIMLIAGFNPVNVVTQTHRTLDSFALMAIPFFLTIGVLAARTSMSQRLLELADLLVGRIRGGLGHVNVLSSILFGGISGSATADVAALGSVLIPMMKGRGYTASYAAAISAASATMGLVLPPSVVMIVYGAFVNTSVGALFLSGILPGLLIGVGFMVVNAVHVRRHNLDSPRPRSSRRGAEARIAGSTAPADPTPPGDQPGASTRLPASRSVFTDGAALIMPRASLLLSAAPAGQSWYRTLLRGVPLMLAPLIIVLGVRGGVFTPTEAGAVGLFYLLVLLCLVYREVRLRQLNLLARESVILYAQPMFAVAASGAFGWVLSLLGAARVVRDLLSSVDLTATTFMLLVVVAFTLIGTFLDSVPAIVVFAPLFSASAAALGVHPVHLGLVITLMLGIGMVTPPYGLALLMATRLAGVTIWQAIRAVVPFWLTCYAVAVPVALSEDLALFLPRLLAPNLF